jgi:hypothetical protein
MLTSPLLPHMLTSQLLLYHQPNITRQLQIAEETKSLTTRELVMSDAHTTSTHTNMERSTQREIRHVAHAKKPGQCPQRNTLSTIVKKSGSLQDAGENEHGVLVRAGLKTTDAPPSTCRQTGSGSPSSCLSAAVTAAEKENQVQRLREGMPAFARIQRFDQPMRVAFEHEGTRAISKAWSHRKSKG